MKGEGKEKGIRFLLQPIAALLIINIYIIMTSCGLPTTDYLYTPKGFSSEGGALVLEHDTKNIDELSSIFLGYEIYYRIFDDEVAAGDSRNLISSMKSSNIIQTANNYKYFPLKHRKKSESGWYSLEISPLIKVSSNTYTKYYLNMKPQETWTLTYEDSEIVIDSIVRNRSDTASSAEIEYADFYLSSEYKAAGDRDYAGSSSSPDIVHIVFFAFAYGFDTSTMRNVYSDPLILDDPVEYDPAK